MTRPRRTASSKVVSTIVKRYLGDEAYETLGAFVEGVLLQAGLIDSSPQRSRTRDDAITERERIVEWLRAKANPVSHHLSLANDIEDGEHDPDERSRRSGRILCSDCGELHVTRFDCPNEKQTSSDRTMFQKDLK